jgi:hypothetical protein
MRSKITVIRVLPRFWLWIIDRIGYPVTSMRLAIFDSICGPEPATWADRQREAEHERLQRAFPAMDLDRKRSKYWADGPK